MDLFVDVARKCYIDDEDDDLSDAKPTKKSSRSLSKAKEPEMAERRLSRSKQNVEDEKTYSAVNRKDEGRGAGDSEDRCGGSQSRGSGGKSGLVSSTKENRCTNNDKQARIFPTILLFHCVTGTFGCTGAFLVAGPTCGTDCLTTSMIQH